MGSLRGPCSSYQKLDHEDAEEVAHRRAQWLIARVLERADSKKTQASMGVRICRLQIKIGKRLKRMRKSVQLSFFAIRPRLCRRAMEQIKEWRWVLGGKEGGGVPEKDPVYGASSGS